MSDPAFYTLEPASPRQSGGIATAAIRRCAICDHMVDSMGGPGSGSICPECAALLKQDRIKMDRDVVVAAFSETVTE